MKANMAQTMAYLGIYRLLRDDHSRYKIDFHFAPPRPPPPPPPPHNEAIQGVRLSRLLQVISAGHLRRFKGARGQPGVKCGSKGRQ